MKTNKEQIYDLVRLHFAAETRGVSTQYIADSLGIKRSNASKLLNELADEKRLTKSNGRPVMYSLREERPAGYRSFLDLTGHDGSLRRAVRLVQAAVMYPQKSMDLHITGARGTGKSLLAAVTCRFAAECGVMPPDAPSVTLDCSQYAADDERALCEFTAAVAGAKRGVLVADNAHMLPARLRGALCSAIDSGGTAPLVIAVTDAASSEAAEDFRNRLPMTVELPPLAERPMAERLELIRRFLTLEAARAKKTLRISSEVLCCLLLYDAEYNVMQIKGDIKTACASAYVRDYAPEARTLEIFIGDFENHVRRGFINYSARRAEMEKLVTSGCDYSFSESSVQMTPIEIDKLLYSYNLYEDLDQKADALHARGVGEKDISAFLSAELEAAFNQYRIDLTRRAPDLEQLAKSVDRRVIDLVEAFLLGASEKFSKTYPSSVHYGLCLHVDSILKGRPVAHPLSAAQISSVFERRRDEYLYSLQFISKLEEEFRLGKLPVDEVILLTMFIALEPPPQRAESRPALLYAMRGTLASPLCSLARTDSDPEAAFAVDIPDGQDSRETYDSLRAAVESADSGGGVLVLYDGELLDQAIASVAAETGHDIRAIPLGLVSAASDWARGAAACSGVDELYARVLTSIRAFSSPQRHVIVTLCSTGMGGAEQMRSYIEQHGDIGGRAVIPLPCADRSALRGRLAAIMRGSVIDCIVGVSDPELFSIPFLSLSEVLSCPPEKLPAVMRFEARERAKIDYDEVYAYLSEQLERVSMKKLRKVLPAVMRDINENVAELPLDSEIGLFIHLACCVNRLMGGGTVKANARRGEIVSRYPRQFREVVSLLKPLEKSFGVIFSDDEVANILTIIYQL